MDPVDTRSAQIENTVGRPVPKTRDQAFQEARERGDSEFIWRDESYHTRTAEEEERERARERANKPIDSGTTTTETSDNTIPIYDPFSSSNHPSYYEKEEPVSERIARAFNLPQDPKEEVEDFSQSSKPFQRPELPKVVQGLDRAGTQILHGVQTLGGSVVGNIINTVNPE